MGHDERHNFENENYQKLKKKKLCCSRVGGLTRYVEVVPGDNNVNHCESTP